MATLHQEHDKNTGLVVEVGEDWVELETILDTGLSDGNFLIPFSEILRLDVDGVSEQIDLAVHRARYGLK